MPSAEFLLLVAAAFRVAGCGRDDSGRSDDFYG
jgi:hypothetical protein